VPVLHASPNGSSIAVWAMPVTIPVFAFTDHVTLLFGPPRVPRSVSEPFRQSAAWRLWFPARFEYPASHPRLFTLFARLFVPPNDRRSVIVYFC